MSEEKIKEKKEKKAGIKKKEFDFEKMRSKFSSTEKYRPTEFLDLGPAFQKACGLPGPALGATNQVLGWSNTGKSTIMTLAGIAAQKKGILPVFIITEQKFSFEHAKQMGLECEMNKDEDGNEYWAGNLLYQLGFEYIEQIFDYINSILDAQKKGEIPYDLIFLWDSIGTIPCKMTYDGKGGTQHTARVIAEKWGMGIAQKITNSNKLSSPYRNTALIVNQPWFSLPDSTNPKAQGRIQPKGGQAIYLSASLVFLCGKQKEAGTSMINLVHKGRKVNFGIRTKLTVMKNHINGLGFADGKIVSVPHGFILDEQEELKKYKSETSKYWGEILNIDMDDSEVEMEEEEVQTATEYED